MQEHEFRDAALAHLSELQIALGSSEPAGKQVRKSGREAHLRVLAKELRAFQAQMGPAEEPALTEAIGDSPSPRDVEQSKGERRRKGSSLTRTA